MLKEISAFLVHLSLRDTLTHFSSFIIFFRSPNYKAFFHSFHLKVTSSKIQRYIYWVVPTIHAKISFSDFLISSQLFWGKWGKERWRQLMFVFYVARPSVPGREAGTQQVLNRYFRSQIRPWCHISRKFETHSKEALFIIPKEKGGSCLSAYKNFWTLIRVSKKINTWWNKRKLVNKCFCWCVMLHSGRKVAGVHAFRRWDLFAGVSVTGCTSIF